MSVGSAPETGRRPMRRALRGFVVGSSLPATVWPIAGLEYESWDLPLGAVDWRFVGFFFPILFGITNAITVSLPGYQSWQRMAVIGGLMGFVSASTGTFLFDIPEIVYGLHGNERYLALVGGPIFYGLVWVLPVRWMNGVFDLRGS